MRIALMSALLSLALVCGNALAQEPTKPPPLFLVHFETGPNWNPDLPPPEQTGFGEHSANLGRLRGEGVIAFGARYGELGMIIVKADSEAEARALMEADPGVKAGIFRFRLDALRVFYPWVSPD